MPIAGTPKNWPLKTYTPGEWTDLVATELAVVKTLLAANTTPGDIDIALRLTDAAGTELVQIQGVTVLAATETLVLDVASLSLTTANKLQVKPSANGVHFLASGAV